MKTAPARPAPAKGRARSGEVEQTNLPAGEQRKVDPHPKLELPVAAESRPDTAPRRSARSRRLAGDALDLPLGDPGAHVSRVVRDIVIPSLQTHGISRIVLGKPHFEKDDVPPTMSFTKRRLTGTPQRARGHITRPARHWPEDAMESMRFPVLCFVLAGEADLTIGDAILHCPAGHAVLTPAGVPIGDGSSAHWLRPNPEQAYSDLLWIHVRTFGAELFVCRTRGTEHISGWGFKRFALAEPQFFTLLEGCIAEMEQLRPLGQVAAAAYLQLFFCLVHRYSGDSTVTPVYRRLSGDAGRSRDSTRREMDDPAVVTRRACEFIEANLRERLNLETIAGAAYVSRSYLAQVFRSELQQTVWEYVSERRIAKAKELLSETDLTMMEVARLSGMSRTAHFFARFAELAGVSPGEYRRRMRAEPSKQK